MEQYESSILIDITKTDIKPIVSIDSGQGKSFTREVIIKTIDNKRAIGSKISITVKEAERD